MDRLNTSYAQKYVVVSKTGTAAILRVVDDSLYQTYWQEFVSADVYPKPPVPPTPPGPEANPMYVRIEQVPQEITLIDQFSDFIPELPITYVEVNGAKYNITGKVAANRPNTEVPGLFRLDYRINFSKKISTVFWSAYVSIQQRPLLRKAAAGWTRDSYITRTLNRLVMEPQFMEALHAAGEPLYGFMQANQHPSIRAAQLSRYGDAQAWGAGKAVGENAESTIFITGARLPQGSIVIYRQRMLQLQEPVYPDVPTNTDHMDLETHTRVPGSYEVGSVRRSGKTSYVCIEKATSEISLNNSHYWRPGYLYRYTILGSDPITLPYGRIPIGKGGVEHIWVTVDNQGYPFWVDIAHTTTVGTYRGHYNPKDFADYNSDDIVSYVHENTIRLFARKHTDIQSESTLAYPPGHYLNPAWAEIYSHMPDDYAPLFSEYFIVPHTNASNAIIAKTWSVSEEMCNAYAHMVGIPQTILDACGAKWSALLFALIVRTRNTYEGLRICMRAVGLDVKNLSLSEPSIAYYSRPEYAGHEIRVTDIYTQHNDLRKLLQNITTLAPGEAAKEIDGNLRYDKDDPNVIQQYSEYEHAWITRYRFSKMEPAQNFNNRYFDGDLDVLSRLAEDAVKDLGDGKQWVSETAWVGEYSRLVRDVIAYEIPIYVWVRLHMRLYGESKIEMETAVYSGVLDAQRCGGKNIIELFPSKYFSRAFHDFMTIPTGVFTLKNGAEAEIPPTRINAETGSKIYEFDAAQYPLRIRALNPGECIFVRYWQSTHTFGLLGLRSSDSTDKFHNVAEPDVTDSSDLMLANGYVGVTALYRPKRLAIDTITALRWMYILNDSGTGDSWQLSETVPFADWGTIAGEDMDPFEGTLNDLQASLDEISDAAHGGNAIPFIWDGDVLALMDCIPEIIYLKNESGTIIGSFRIIPEAHTLSAADWETYRRDTPAQSVRIAFAYG